MKTLNLKEPLRTAYRLPELGGLLGLLILIWPIAQRFVLNNDQTIGTFDPNIYLCILLSVICFLSLTALCWWLLTRVWIAIGLPGISGLVIQLKSMEAWQQLGFFWASFGLLLLAATGCLMAIC